MRGSRWNLQVAERLRFKLEDLHRNVVWNNNVASLQTRLKRVSYYVGVEI